MSKTALISSEYNKDFFNKNPTGLGIASGCHGQGLDFNLYYLKEAILKNDLDRNRKLNVLEVGCGCGQYIKWVKKEYPLWNTYAIDFSEQSIDIAKQDNCDVNFSLTNVTNTEFENNKFDFIFGVDIFEHLDNIEDGFKEMSRILKDGGIFHLSIPLTGGVNYVRLTKLLSKKLNRIYCENTGHFTIIKMEDLLYPKYLKKVDVAFSNHVFGNVRDSFYYFIDPYFKFGKISGTIYRTLCKILEKLTTYESKLLLHTYAFALIVHITYKKDCR